MKRVGFGALVAGVIGLAVLNVLVWSGFLVSEKANTVHRAATTAPPPPPPAAVTKTPPPATTPITTRPAPPAISQPTSAGTTVLVSATRGDCWVEARLGSSSGRVLYQGLLASGKSVRLSGQHVWLRLGAAWHVDISVNGKPEKVPSGTTELILPKTSV